jgi:transposase InsO family protein
LDRAERARIRKEILARTYTAPDGETWRIAERTLNSWLARYTEEGLAGLEHRRHKRLGEMRALDEKVLEDAKELRERMRSRSIEDIRMHLKYVNKADISKVSASTLNRHLNRIGASKDKNYSEKGSFQPFRKEHINQLWQSDCSDGIWLPDPTGLKELRQTTLITFIDDASRYCVHGQFYYTEQLVDLLDCMRTALLSRGKASTFYTDNGSIYTANDFVQICAQLGIRLKHSEKQQPEGKGKQERHYLTIQMRFYKEAQKSGIIKLEELNEFFWAWLDECYHKVKHRSLGMTPLERWQMEEELVERISFEQLHEAMQLRTRRKIDSRTALIRLSGKLYQASQHLAGQRVQVRWPFDDDSAVNIFRQGAFVERAELYVPPSDIDYSKRPDRRANKQDEPKVLDCSKQFRAALVAKFRGEKAPEHTSRFGVLSEREFIYVCGQSLGRSVDDTEKDALVKAYKRLFPMDAAFVENCLQRAKAVKGEQMHIGFYVRCMEESKQTR